MRKPKYSDCTDEHGEFDGECFADACDRYNDEIKDDIVEKEMIKQEESSDSSMNKDKK